MAANSALDHNLRRGVGLTAAFVTVRNEARCLVFVHCTCSNANPCWTLLLDCPTPGSGDCQPVCSLFDRFLNFHWNGRPLSETGTPYVKSERGFKQDLSEILAISELTRSCSTGIMRNTQTIPRIRSSAKR